MKFRSMDDKDMDDIGSPEDFRLALRFYHILMHPNNPVTMSDADARELSWHITRRYTRFGPGTGPGKGNGRKGVGIGPRV